MEQIQNTERKPEELVEKKEEKETKTTQKAASFCQLQYSMSKGMDCVIIVIGICGSLGMGIAMPLFSIIFGGTINSFGSQGGTTPELFIEQIKDLCLKFLYVGLGMFAAGFIMIWMWNLNGRTIAKRIKKQYFRLLMNQEQGYYDQIKPFEFATKVQTQVKTIEMGVSINYLTLIY